MLLSLLKKKLHVLDTVLDNLFCQFRQHSDRSKKIINTPCMLINTLHTFPAPSLPSMKTNCIVTYITLNIQFIQLFYST